jgi:hypothetical protein
MSGARDSHGDGGRFVRQPCSPSAAFGVHASGSIASSLAGGRRFVVNRIDAGTMAEPALSITPLTVTSYVVPSAIPPAETVTVRRSHASTAAAWSQIRPTLPRSPCRRRGHVVAASIRWPAAGVSTSSAGAIGGEDSHDRRLRETRSWPGRELWSAFTLRP